MKSSERIKNQILKSRFAVPARKLQSHIIVSQMTSCRSSEIIGNKTVYSISPYKTGSTYLASCFNKGVSKHEPLMYLTLKNFDRDFDGFFVKRLNHLNLKLECSGFLSGYMDKILNHQIAKNLNFICVLRSPSSWVTSVINYWYDPIQEFPYDVANELFWKKRIGVDLRSFKIGEENANNQEIINKLIKFYFDFTKKAMRLKNIKFIKLKELDKSLSYISNLINESPEVINRKRHGAKNKTFQYKNSKIDADYALLTTNLISN